MTEQAAKALALNFRVMCAGFFLLFFAFWAAQNYVTTALGDIGDYSLSAIYTSLALSALLAPWLLCKLHADTLSLRAERKALILGSALYAPFLGVCAAGTNSRLSPVQVRVCVDRMCLHV